MLVMEKLRVQGLERVIHWIIQKELWFEINKAYMMVKVWVSHSELQTEANLGVMNDQGNVRAKTKRWWHDSSGRKAPLVMGEDAGKWVKQKYGTKLW